MEPALINIDGHVDLIDQAGSPDPNSTGDDRVRLSRLNDVMIVLEREKAAFEDAVKTRLIQTVLTDGVENLTINLDEQAPKFSIAIHRAVDTEAAQNVTVRQRASLEAETTAAIVETIQKHASYAEKPRWQPSVTAVYRRTAAKTANQQTRLKSIWLRTLFWLLAIVILGVAYLYLKQGAV